jgi:dihydrofolate synthase / folylpolyglutamate synthase
MTYQQTLEYLFARLPMYQRIGAAAYKADLNNTIKIAEVLGKPHQKLKCIHIAGTNGKGSSSHMLAAILQKAGYKTGLYTSPHLIDFRERIRINGKMIPKNYITEFVETHKTAFEAIQPSFFEWTFGLALDYFRKSEVDVAVIETGLGGRLDSTNIIVPKVCLITNVSMDHTELLGDSIEKIATEKAGIIKARVPVVISQHQVSLMGIFSTIAAELRSEIEYADKNYKVIAHETTEDFLTVKVLNKKTDEISDYQLDLTGEYQLNNLLGVLNTIDFIEKAGFMIQKENIYAALKQVSVLTGLKGRWQKLGEKPLMLADTGHNEEGIRSVVAGLTELKFNKLHFVYGAVNDKDLSKILKLLPPEAQYYFVKADVPRALDAKELEILAQQQNLTGKSYPTVEAGLIAAKKAAKKTDLIFIGGSTFVVGEALELLSEA